MREATERDRGLLSLVERIMKRPVEPAPKAADGDGVDLAKPVIANDLPLASLEPQLSIESTRSVSRTEMAEMILRALAARTDCPKSGFEVTVYGIRPWNAMLRITPAAGPIKDAAVWRERVREMLPRLREQYDLSD
ncbi:MAG: hypothetical protein ABWY18_12850 [Tardiphaga sp.]